MRLVEAVAVLLALICGPERTRNAAPGPHCTVPLDVGRFAALDVVLAQQEQQQRAVAAVPSVSDWALLVPVAGLSRAGLVLARRHADALAGRLSGALLDPGLDDPQLLATMAAILGRAPDSRQRWWWRRQRRTVRIPAVLARHLERALAPTESLVYLSWRLLALMRAYRLERADAVDDLVGDFVVLLCDRVGLPLLPGLLIGGVLASPNGGGWREIRLVRCHLAPRFDAAVLDRVPSWVLDRIAVVVVDAAALGKLLGALPEPIRRWCRPAQREGTADAAVQIDAVDDAVLFALCQCGYLLQLSPSRPPRSVAASYHTRPVTRAEFVAMLDRGDGGDDAGAVLALFRYRWLVHRMLAEFSAEFVYLACQVAVRLGRYDVADRLLRLPGRAAAIRAQIGAIQAQCASEARCRQLGRDDPQRLLLVMLQGRYGTWRRQNPARALASLALRRGDLRFVEARLIAAEIARPRPPLPFLG